MATITAAAGGGNWSATGTWVGGVVPTAADDVVLASTSGNVTVDAASYCRSLDCQASGNYASTLAVNANLYIGDATPGMSNRAIRLAAPMTLSGFGAVVLQSTSATQQTITSAGKTFSGPGGSGSILFIGFPTSPGNWILTDALAVNGGIQFACGTFNTGNQSVTCGRFSSSNSNTRTLTLGSSTITLTGAGATVWDTSTATNLTLNAGTSTITASGAGPTLLFGSGLTFGSLTLSGSGTAQIVSGGSATFANITRAGTAAKTDALSVTASPTVTGTFTVTGNSATNRVLVTSSTTGTARTFTAAATSLTNADFQDITGAGAASWTGTSLGDCGGNTGITFTAATTRYAVAAGNWSSTAVWSATSGGSAGASVPLPQDAAVLNASSGVGTITIDMPRVCKDLTCTGYTGTVSCAIESSVFGSITLASGMTWSHTFILQAAGRGAHFITSAGKSLCGQLNVLAIGGSYSLADALTIYSWGSGVQVLSGTLATNGFSIAAAVLQTSSGATVNLGTSTVTLSGSNGLPASLNVSPGSALNAGTSTIVLADTSASTKTFAGGGKVYNNLVIQGGALNSVVITGANTFNNVSAPAGTVLTLPASTTTTATGTVDLTGTRYNGLRLPGVPGNYASTPDAAALRVTGDLEFVCRIAPSSWTPVAMNAIAARRATAGNASYEFFLDTSGRVGVGISVDGANFSVAFSSVAVGFAAGTTGWVKMTRRSSDGRVQFFTAADQATEPGTWTQLGTDQTVTSGALYAGTSPLEVGSWLGGVQNFLGTFYRAIIRSGIGGTTVFDADFTTKPWGADSFTEAQGATVTINGDLARAGDGRVMLVSSTPGTAATLSKASGVVNGDYLAVRDVTATGGATFNAGVRSTLSNATGWNATGTLNKVATFTLGLAPRAFVSKSVGVAALFPLGLMPRDAATAGAARPITWQRLDVGANA